MLDRDPALRYARDADGVSVYTLACLKGQPKIAEELAGRGVWCWTSSKPPQRR